MTYSSSSLNLTGQFLIAMPQTEGDIFSQSVIFICEHTSEGAMGLIINKVTNLSSSELLKSAMKDSVEQVSVAQKMIFFGGPVCLEGGFVLHTPLSSTQTTRKKKRKKITDETENSILKKLPKAEVSKETKSEKTMYWNSMRIGGFESGPTSIDLTISKDVLDDIAKGAGPSQYLILKGCAAWEAGQLEQEILNNCWLTAPMNEAIIFEEHCASRYEKALALLGVDLAMLGSHAGHA